MSVIVDVINASDDEDVPTAEDFRQWTAQALKQLESDRPNCEISIRIVDEAESAHLNEAYRKKSGPTNVLSFPFSSYHPEDVVMMGDLAICAPVVRREADEQGKDPRAHWAHLCIHGVLHLHGYDHERAAEAEIMESLEIDVLRQLGFENPYQTPDNTQ